MQNLQTRVILTLKRRFERFKNRVRLSEFVGDIGVLWQTSECVATPESPTLLRHVEHHGTEVSRGEPVLPWWINYVNWRAPNFGIWEKRCPLFLKLLFCLSLFALFFGMVHFIEIFYFCPVHSWQQIIVLRALFFEVLFLVSFLFSAFAAFFFIPNDFFYGHPFFSLYFT